MYVFVDYFKAKKCVFYKFQRMMNLKQDTARTEKRDISQINSVQSSKDNINVFQLTVER